MTMVNLIIDETEVSAAGGTTVLEAALEAGIYIPHICAHPDLSPVEVLKPAEAVFRGKIRLENRRPDLEYDGCQLCVVEIKGRDGLHRACTIPVEEGMVVSTDTPEVREFRRDRLMSILAKHPHACLTCAQEAGCARSPCSTNIPVRQL